MPIVPITNDISIRTIRDVINQKAVILGQVRYRGTTYGLYGADQATGKVQTVLQNIQPTGDITLKVTLNRQGTEYGTQTLTLSPGQKKNVNFNGLAGKTGSFSKGHITNYKPAGSYSSNFDYDLTIVEISPSSRTASINNIPIGTLGNVFVYEPIAFFSEYPIVDIAIARDNGNVTANYQLKDNVQIPKQLPDTPTPVDAALSDWRGAQVIHGTANIRTSRTGKYISETNSGYIVVKLDPIGFSNGTVTVTIPNIKSICKNISHTGDRNFIFTGLPSKAYTVYIKDDLTGISTSMVFNIGKVNYNTNRIHNTYSFNGLTRILAFTF